MSKNKRANTMFSYFKPIEKNMVHMENAQANEDITEPNVHTATDPIEMDPPIQPPPTKIMRTEQDSIDLSRLIRDPGERPQISDYPINQHDEIRLAYLKFGPYHFMMDEYPLSGPTNHPRRFQAHWFKTFPWLEYSPQKDEIRRFQKLRDCGWDSLLSKIISFCESQAIPLPDMSASFSDIIRSRRKKDNVTVEHHYRVDIFTNVIDYQMKELNSRFSEQATRLLSLSTSLDPKDNFKSFNSDRICELVDEFYPSDFSNQERNELVYELQLYEIGVVKNPGFQNLSTAASLCQKLVASGKCHNYPLIDRLLRLVLTLPVSTATTERAFSAMKILKTRLRNKMGDEFLKDSMIVYIEKELAAQFSTDMIIDDFDSIKPRRANLKVRAPRQPHAL